MTEAEQKTGTALEQFKARMLTPERAAELFASLPRHIKPERFERNLTNLLMQTPDLLRHDERLVLREVSKIALLGLYLDKDLGEAYLIEAYNHRTKRTEPQARIGYRGLIKLVKQSGKIGKIYAREVRQHDQYDVLQGTDERIVHRPVLYGDPGPVIEYYAVAQMTDGGAEFERMTVDEVLQIRDRSEAWKSFQAQKIKSTPWDTDAGEMAKKTVIRRLAKRLDMAPELLDAVKIEDEAEYASLRDVTPAARPTLVAPPAPKAEIVAPSPTTQQKRTAPKRVAAKLGGRDATPYAAQPEQEAPKRKGPALRYPEEESGARLDSLMEDLGGPMSDRDLTLFVENYTPVVQRMIPEHQRVAEQRLADRSEEITGNKWTFGTKHAEQE